MPKKKKGETNKEKTEPYKESPSPEQKSVSYERTLNETKKLRKYKAGTYKPDTT